MILGILSDSHGQHRRTSTALALLRQLGAEAFVHCGDVGGVEVLDTLAGLRAWVVCGNTDCPDAALVHYAEAQGIVVAHVGPARIELDGRHLAAFHGHEPGFGRLMNVLASGALPPDFGRCDFVLHGHTHEARTLKLGRVRVINPGALHRAVVHSVATLDLRKGVTRFWEVSDDPADLQPREYHPDANV